MLCLGSCLLSSSVLQLAVTNWVESNLESDSTATDSIATEPTGGCLDLASTVEEHSSGLSLVMLLTTLKSRSGDESLFRHLSC